MADPQRLETTHQQVDLPAGLNIVSTVNLECTLNLKAIPRQANTAEYNPEIMDAVIMRIKEPKTTALIFASGKMVCTGAKNEKESRVAARKFVSIMQRIGYPTNFKDFKIRNIICSYDVKFPTRLEGLACSHGSFYCLLRELGVDTSIPVAAARQLNLGSNPGSRDTRSRGIDFAVHRQRVAERQQMDTAHVKKTDPERVDMTEGMNAAYSHDSNSDDSDSTCVFRVTKGRGSIKRSKTSDDERWIVKGPMPGGPIYDTVIPSFLGHVASRMWNCEMRGILKCHNRLAVCQRLRDWYGRMSKDAWQMISWTRLSHLHSTMFSHIDTPLVSAFIERWQPDTNTFHMPFGEMTIMLHDVWHILRVPVDGRMVSADPDSSELKSDCMRLMGMSRQDLSGHWQGRGVLTDSFITLCGQNRYNETQAIAWMWMLLDSTLFVDKIENRTRASCLHEVKDGLDGVDGYSWGSATLAYLYRQLGVASRGDSQGIAGCVTLLQAWIYEYFPCFRPHQKWMILDPDSPRVCMWSVRAEDKSNCRLWSLRTRLDQMTASDVTWLPYGTDPASTVPRTIFSGWLRYRGVIEPYMPVRVLRQLGYVQAIPSRILRPVKAVRSWASKSYKVEVPEVLATDSWDIFPDSFILSISRYHIASEDPTTCDPDYMSWYYRHSHPKVLNVGAPSTGVPIPRSNTGYWFSRWAVLNWRIVEALREENEQAAAAHTIVLEQIMEDWRRAS